MGCGDGWGEIGGGGIERAVGWGGGWVGGDRGRGIERAEGGVDRNRRK